MFKGIYWSSIVAVALGVGSWAFMLTGHFEHGAIMGISAVVMAVLSLREG